MNDRRRLAAGGNDLFTQMMRLPMAAFFYSLEWMVRAMGEMPGMAGLGPRTECGASAGDRDRQDTQGSTAPRQEGETMTTGMRDDQDLSGDQLKYVSYAILFTKRDLEVTLEEDKQDLVSYPTNGGSYGGLKLAKFMAKVLRGEVPRPRKWIENNYPSGAQGEYGWEIPDEDEKYITFLYKVEDRLDRQEANYARDQVRVLQEISRKIG